MEGSEAEADASPDIGGGDDDGNDDDDDDDDDVGNGAAGVTGTPSGEETAPNWSPNWSPLAVSSPLRSSNVAARALVGNHPEASPAAAVVAIV